MTEIKAIESGQKDALLRRANIKKTYIYIFFLSIRIMDHKFSINPKLLKFEICLQARTKKDSMFSKI